MTRPRFLPHPLLALNERLEGWIQWQGSRQFFAVDLDACATDTWFLDRPMPLSGYARIGEDSESWPVDGDLTLHIDGPEYRLRVHHESGILECHGRKTYRLGALRYTLTTCPLSVDRDGQRVGGAELAWRAPLWRFPLDCLSLRWRSDTKNETTS
ncbi:hypothetical protein [Mangrovitalea sediminis]|uniref:hypothetical protein n=1 Tax=Mangrovitalea sediminis TaxID=1982043 RepID=UPI000BE50A6D|nr:hypothetical protein [Mangrovitalea sediminis]